MNSMNEIRKNVKEAFELLDKVTTKVMNEHKSLISHNLTAKQLLILKTIFLEGKMTVNELSTRLDLSASSISQLLNKMEKGSYIKREINPDNRREIFVTTDQKGKELFEAYQKVDDYIIEKYYSKFTVEEVIVFKDLVKKLYGIVHE
ncbi:MarR family winged helix-turn-helix transcriptional regulator [Bacillus salitolerans]|uniref:MarR family winged helix-turn-helix transcriptional regulator n=1 Tax=Bacillus salitolerans TaxID=1437434 RepID=A0ABW4LMW4_9BACI